MCISLEEKIIDYAALVNCSLEIAKKRVMHFTELENKIQKARICPECGKESLMLETTDREYSNESWIQCEECDFTSELTEQFSPLCSGYDFDVVLWFAMDIKQYELSEVEHQIGSTWAEFVEKDTNGLEQSL